MTNEIDGPAFPTNTGLGNHQEEGMTLRDYFAAKAMQALLARLTYGIGDDPTDVATVAYDYAEAMLKARK